MYIFIMAVRCQVAVSATDRSIVQSSPTESGMSNCGISNPQQRDGLGQSKGVAPHGKNHNDEECDCKYTVSWRAVTTSQTFINISFTSGLQRVWSLNMIHIACVKIILFTKLKKRSLIFDGCSNCINLKYARI